MIIRVRGGKDAVISIQPRGFKEAMNEEETKAEIGSQAIAIFHVLKTTLATQTFEKLLDYMKEYEAVKDVAEPAAEARLHALLMTAEMFAKRQDPTKEDGWQ